MMKFALWISLLTFTLASGMETCVGDTCPTPPGDEVDATMLLQTGYAMESKPKSMHGYGTDVKPDLMEKMTDHHKDNHTHSQGMTGCMKMKTMFDTDTSRMSPDAAWVATHVDFARQSVRRDTECDKCGSSSTYSETIDTSGEHAKRIVSSSGCPNHYNYVTGRQGNTGIGVEGTITWSYEQSSHENVEIPANPVLLSMDDAFGIEYRMGMIGIALNGVAFYGGAVDTDGNILDVDDDKAEWTSFDFCSGHASGFGEYHYHFPPSCLLDKLTKFSDGHSPQIGWSLDGFPIYGVKGPSGVDMKHCGTSDAHSDYCTDDCSGYEGELPGIDNFKYRYYITGATSDLSTLPSYPRPAATDYPFTIKCYRGCEMGKMSNRKCSKRAVAGYTDAYTATANSGFTEVLTFANDKKCTSSTTPAPTPAPTTGECYSWCANNPKSWDKKCNWAKCEGCSECR